MPGVFATDTSVPIERSKAEIERTLARYGADQFMYGAKSGEAMVVLRMKNKNIRYHLPLPPISAFTTSNAGRRRTESSAFQAMDQEHRRLWRCLCLGIKAKLELVASGIATFEDEFLAYIVLPGGATVSQHILPHLERAYEDGKVTPMMLAWENRE